MGLLVSGHLVEVPGLVTLSPSDCPGGRPWCRLDPRDYRMRRETVRQVVMHTTVGADSQRVIPGRGPGGHAERTARAWQEDPSQSSAQLVVDSDGVVACLADLARICAYHATVSNEYSVGVEMHQEADGGVYDATLSAATLLVSALCEILDFPFTVVSDPYIGHPIPRFARDGAPDFYGVLGHRHNTEQRGWGDPGDEIFLRLVAAGGERVAAERGQDLQLAAGRQRWLNARGGRLVVDGRPGPKTMAEMRRQQFSRWRDVPTG